jgi:hypothetical protein
MTGREPSGLAVALDEAATQLEGVVRRETQDGLEWSIGGIVFAMIRDGRGEFRLAPQVVAAALRTPDTEPSTHGRDWVAFAPAELDRHALDRATAWLASAWRRAGAEG